MTTWSNGGTDPASNWNGADPDPASAWDECAPEPDSSWRPCSLSLDPDSGAQGATVSITITGDGFTPATTVQVSGAGIVVQNLVYVSPSMLTVDFVIGAAATVDTRIVTVATGAHSEVAGFAVILAGVPAVPANLQAAGASISTMTLSWAAVDGATYDIQRNGVTIASGLAIGTVSYLDTGLSAATAYSYTIRACNAAGCSAFSDAALGTTLDWTSIANRVVWVEGDANADLTIATGVSAWRDHSGNGRQFAQATGAKQPTVVAAAMKGRQAIRFDGLDDLMTLLSDFELNAGSTLVIAASVRFVNDTNYRPLLRIANSNATALQHQASNDTNAPSRSRLETFMVGSGGLKRATPVAVTTQEIRCWSVVVDVAGNGLTLRKDGVVIAGPVAGMAGIATTIGDTLRLCADETGVNFGTYDVGTVRLFSRALSATERQAVEADAMSLWVP